jgi:hypothetical protein
MVIALVVAPAAIASPRMLVGLLDDANTLGDPTATFPVLKALHVEVVRMTLNWRAVAPRQPESPRDPSDPAYDWARADAAIGAAAKNGIAVLLTIWGTPAWANGGRGPVYAPSHLRSLYDFAYAAATRYSGRYLSSGRPLPRVRLWLAWNEPNNPIDLAPQYRRVRGRWVIASAAAYAHICSAVYAAVHAAQTGAEVGCGATAPRGNDDPSSSRPSVDPLAFLRAVRAAGLRSFDAWAHHPYYGSHLETPTTRPPAADHAVELGNIDVLIRQLTLLYGRRRVWITEYGFQTNPPDRLYGVSWAMQSRYLTEAFTVARRNPRIDLMIWFLLKDDTLLGGWQSGLETASGVRKPAFSAYQLLTARLGSPLEATPAADVAPDDRPTTEATRPSRRRKN